MSVVDQMGWDEEKQKRCKNYLTPEYTSSDEDETGPDEEIHRDICIVFKKRSFFTCTYCSSCNIFPFLGIMINICNYVNTKNFSPEYSNFSEVRVPVFTLFFSLQFILLFETKVRTHLWLGFASEDLGVLSTSDASLFVAEESYA